MEVKTPGKSAEQPAFLERIGLRIFHTKNLTVPNIALRPMGDIDLLVKKEDLEKASETLIRLGYIPERHLNIQDMVKILHHLPIFIKAGSPVLEIHWNIEIPTYPLTIDMDALWERAEKTSINGVETLTLSPVDLLLHLCVHVSLHHGFECGLKRLYDIYQVVHSFGSSFDWGTLIRRSQEWGAGKIVYTALFMINKIFRAPVPDYVLRTLEPDSPDKLTMIMLSEELVFAKPSPLSPNVARLWGKYSIVDKLATCMKSVFPSRGVMSTIYPVSASSLKIYFYYPLRIKDLFHRYGATLIKLFAPDREFLGDADIKNKESRLKDWLLKI